MKTENITISKALMNDFLEVINGDATKAQAVQSNPEFVENMEALKSFVGNLNNKYGNNKPAAANELKSDDKTFIAYRQMEKGVYEYMAHLIIK